MKISVYGTVSYDRAAKVRWLLQEMGITYEDRRLDLEGGDLEKPEFLKISPLGRVPVVEIGDRSMIESGAICAHLADLFAEKGMAPLLSAPERMEYQQWMYFAISVDGFASRISIIEDIPPGEVADRKLEILLAEVRDYAAYLDQVVAKKEFLIGKFSAADICVTYHLYIASLWPEMDGIFKDFPQLVAYLERMKTRPAAVKAQVFSYEG